jgi:RNA polymerase sigma factor (TIGR02999 family)
MTTPSAHNVTQLLLAWGAGDQAARDELLPLVYEELGRMAHRHLRQERQGHTLQTSALINEAYLRLVDQPVSWQNRAHFFGIASRLMRQILVDYAIRRQQQKRGGQWQQISLAEVDNLAQRQATDLLALDEALKSLAEIDPRKSQVVELRFFGGLTIEETAEVLRVSTVTIERDWRLARTWLLRELSRGSDA